MTGGYHVRRDRRRGTLRRIGDSHAVGAARLSRAARRTDDIPERYRFDPFHLAAGVARLKRWGLLERALATHCPVIRTIGLDLGEFQLTGDPLPFDRVGEMWAPRRTVLDKLLLDAAAEAGAEAREGFPVTGLTSSAGRVTGTRGRPKGGAEIAERALIVIRADGRNSLVAKTVGAEEYNVRPVLTWRAAPTDAT